MANSNQHQSFGFGGRPQFKNESVPPSPTGTAGPLPGMMSMNPDRLLDVLPEQARERYHALEQERDEAGVLVRAIVEDQQRLQIEIQRHQGRIRQLQTARGMGGHDLTDDAVQVTHERRALDEKRAEQRRLNARNDDQGAKFQRAAALLHAIDKAIVGRPRATTGAMVTVELPPIKGNILDRVADRRRRLRELQVDLVRCRSAPWPSSVAKERMREQVAQLAAQGAPDVTGAVEHGSEIAFPVQSRQVDIHNVPGGAIGFAEQPNSIELIAFLFKDTLVSKLDALIDECADDPAAMTAEQRQKAIAEIERDMLMVAHEECRLVEAAQKQGLPAMYRTDCDPLAVLAINWVPAPPVPREGAGQVGAGP